MANKFRPKQAGTTESTFEIGLNKVTLDFSALTVPRLLKFPDSDGTAGYVLSTNGAGVLSWVHGGTGSGITQRMLSKTAFLRT